MDIYATHANPLIRSLRLPGETVTLPSKALFYKNGEVAPEVMVNGEVYVQPMSTHDEILMKTPDMLFTGQAIVQVFSRCIPQIYNPLALLATDIDFLFVVLRKVSLGPTVSIKYQHDCENAQSHDYDVNIHRFVVDTKFVDHATIEHNFQHTLPNGQHIMLRPFTIQDVLTISQIAVNEPVSETRTDLEAVDFFAKFLVAGITPAVISVTTDDGQVITDPASIAEWVELLPGDWLRALSEVIERANKWGLDSVSKVQCTDCGELVDVKIPLNPTSFFTLPSKAETPLQ